MYYTLMATQDISIWDETQTKVVSIITDGSNERLATDDKVTNGSGASAVNIQDGGNTITVDGSVTVTQATGTNLHVVTDSQTPGTGATNLGKAEDAGHTSGDVGVMALAVRNDAGTALAGTTLDYIPLTTDNKGKLYVNATLSGFPNGYVDNEVTWCIEQGIAFWATGNYTTIAGNGTLTILIITPASPFCNMRDMTVNITKSGNTDPCLLRLWEGATTSASGSSVTAYNNKRDSATAATTTIFTSPTITTTGTKIIEYVAHTDWETYMAPSYTSPFKVILKVSTKYLFQIVNTSNQPVTLTWQLFWLEEAT